MHEFKMVAGSILSFEKLRLLEEAGLTVIPKAAIERLKKCQDEEVLIVGERPIVIRSASPNDVERINSGYVCMD